MLYPVSVAAAADGRLFVADQDLPGVWKVSEGKAEVFFQAEKKNRTPLNALRCVGWDHEAKLLAGDAATMDIYRFGEEPKPEPLTSGGIRTPVDLAVGSDGTIYVADADNAVIWRMPTAGGKPERFVELRGPRGLAMVDGTLWAASLGEHQLVRISADGKVTPAVEGRPFSFPNDVALDTNGTAYVSDGYAKTIWKVDSSGKATKWASGEPLIGPVGLAWRGETLLAADPKARNVLRSPRMASRRRWSRPASSPLKWNAGLSLPEGAGRHREVRHSGLRVSSAGSSALHRLPRWRAGSGGRPTRRRGQERVVEPLIGFDDDDAAGRCAAEPLEEPEHLGLSLDIEGVGRRREDEPRLGAKIRVALGPGKSAARD